MEELKFIFQIDNFITNNDDWENKDQFWCVYNSGYFLNTLNESARKWTDERFSIGKVAKDEWRNSFNLIKSTDHSYLTEEEALKALELKEKNL